jgi:hypothetical protein
MNRGEHLTIEGLQKIVAIKASMNRGLSDKLKQAFPNIIPVTRPLVLDQVVTNPYWLAGFTSGEGCFMVKIFKSLTKVGEAIKLEFIIVQHSRDSKLMESLVSYFGCGRYVSYENKDLGEFIVTKFSDLTNKIIPFFNEYNIVGVKFKDFSDFNQVVELMKNKAHLTREGLEKIKKIKTEMNRGRKEV